MAKTKKILLNEKEVTEEELEKKKEEVEEMPNAKLVEKKPGHFKVRIYD